MMARLRGAWRGSRCMMSRAPGCPVFKVMDDELPRALADGSLQRLYRGEGRPSHPCRFANVIEAFAHCRRSRAHRCRVVWVAARSGKGVSYKSGDETTVAASRVKFGPGRCFGTFSNATMRYCADHVPRRSLPLNSAALDNTLNLLDSELP